MTINTGNTKEQSNGLNLKQLTDKLNANPIKFYVESKLNNKGLFLNEQEKQTLQSQNKLYLHNVLSGGIKTELKKITDKDYNISGMIKYFLNQIYIENPNNSDLNSILIHKFYNELYEEKSKLANFKKYIGNKCSNLLKGLTNRS
ncbi:MAG: hypothetical protein WC850_04650 [Candidatus Gracilibacteria bacterium]